MQLRELYAHADSLVTTSYTVAHGDVHPASNGVSAAPGLDIPDREDGLKFHSRKTHALSATGQGSSTLDNPNRITARIGRTLCIARSTATHYANVEFFSPDAILATDRSCGDSLR